MISTSPQRPDLFVLDAALHAERAYWAERLSAAVDPVGLPADGDGPSMSWRETLPASLAKRLDRVSGGSPLLRFSALTAGLAACLTRGHAFLGSPALVEAPPNTLALVIEVEPEKPFRQLLLGTRDALREAYNHQRYPWPRLARETGAPPFRLAAALAGLHGPLPLGCDLLLTFGAGEVEVTGLYRPSTVQRFLARFAAGLEAALRDVEKPLRSLVWLSDSERHQLRHEWASGPEVAIPSQCLHHLVAAQPPGNVAVIDAKGTMTYGELNHRANGLACWLRSQGIEPESRVGVLIERSRDLAVALLGVLKAGAAYVPLDPTLPQERLRFLTEDSQASLILSEIPDVQGEDPAVAVAPENLAYVIYTSGSTGRPKGVMISHGGLVNYLRWASAAYEVAAGEGAPVHTSIGFDLTVTSLWSPLISGRSVRMLSGDSPAEALLAAREGGYALSLAKITPAHLELLLATLPDPGLAAGARCWVLGGEALRGEQVAPFRQAAPGTRWINEYGPTETVVGCCVHEAEDEDLLSPGAVPIGRPIANTVLRLLSPDLAPVPPGETGELYVGGHGVARGYWRQPALTAERFVPDAWSETPGARLYWTGDLAVYRPDGVLVYLGRADGQVKIRGHRIEPAEIESVLARHPAVRVAVVVAREDVPGMKRLVAYVVPAGDALPAHAELRAHAAESLPEPMVPSAFVVLPALPLTPNGKVDRNALPTPAAALQGPEDGELPLRPLEEILAGIWADVLGLERVGRRDDFFELGGHSLLAAQVAARLRRTLGIELPVRTFFEVPSLGRFTAAVEALSADRTPPVERIERGGDLPLSFAQQRLWFLEHLRPGMALCNLPMALKIEGDLKPDLLRRGLNEVVRRHEPLRTVFPMGSGEPVQRILPPSPVPLPVIDLSGLEGSHVEALRIAAEEARRPLDLENGSLLRVLLLRTGEAEHTLVVVMHHIVSDGWSLRVLVRELTAFYRSFAEGLPSYLTDRSDLTDLSYQYADFAAWQRRLFEDGGMEEHLRYWLQRLAGQTTPAVLPADRPRPEVRSYRGRLIEVEIPGVALASLQRLSRSEGVTLFMTVLAALQVVLRHRTGADRVVVGTDVASRGSVETEAMIGFFVNQLVLATDLGGDPSFRGLLARVRETALGAYAHQDLPFDRIVEALNLRRDLKQTALFQTKLIFQNLPEAAVEVSGLRFAPLTLDTGTAQLDLTLALWEAGDTLRGWVNYSTDLFDEGSVRRLCDALGAVLAEAAEQPDVRLSRLDISLSKTFKRNQPVEKTTSAPAAKPSPFKSVKPKTVSLAPSEQLVATSTLAPDQPLPLVFTPQVPELDLPEWAASNRKQLEEQLRKHGALLFRGFSIDSPESFERFAAAVCDELFNENGEHPRENVSGNVYTPVFYPPDKQLLWHNENSFNHQWPSKILFCCMEPPASGGETPIVDSREVFARLSPEIRDRLVEKGVLYTRSYGNGLGLTWQDVFQTTDKAEVEERCNEEGFVAEWKERDTLRTSCRRPAAVLHPVTGEPVWFNQAQHWHVSCLDPETRASILALFPEDSLPRNCYQGDGSPLADEDMAAILDVYRELEVSFPWQRGDILMLDNLLTAHGRNAFSGRRKILVALGDMKNYDQVIDPGTR